MNELSVVKTQQGGTYCSRKINGVEDAKVVLKAVNDSDAALNTLINKEIVVKDVYAEQVEIVDEKTGEVRQAVRTVLMTEDGKSYTSCSNGVFMSLTKIFALLGTPDTWERAYKFLVKQKETKRGRVFVLTLNE